MPKLLSPANVAASGIGHIDASGRHVVVDRFADMDPGMFVWSGGRITRLRPPFNSGKEVAVSTRAVG
jgi:hypothetical protein